MQPNTVQSTTNYAQFNKLSSNRDVDENHVNAVVKSFEEHGNFTQSQPIIVNENMEVVDGQHRLNACERLGQPVFYSVVQGLNVNDARHMNILQRKWTPVDYMNSYAKEGIQSYIELSRLHEDYPEVNMTLLRYYAVGGNKKGIGAAYRRGEFPEFDVEAARERLDHLVEIAAIEPVVLATRFGESILMAMRLPSYDKKRMVAKIKQRNGDIVVYQGSMHNLRQLENIFNQNYAEVNRARFF